MSLQPAKPFDRSSLTLVPAQRIVRAMTRRNIVLAAVVILVVAVGVVMMVTSRADRLVKDAIERHGSAVTQTPVRVGRVEIRLGSATAALRDLTVANPPGFSAEPVMRLDEVEVALDAASLGTDVLVLKEVKLVAPRIRFEVDANRKANIDVLARNVGRHRRRVEQGEAATPSAPTARRAERTRLLIKQLSITGGRVEIDATALGGQRRVVDLPDTQMTGIGEGRGGATGDQVAEVVVLALVSDVATTVAAAQVQTKIEEAVGGKAGKAIAKGLGETLKGLGDVLKDMIK